MDFEAWGGNVGWLNWRPDDLTGVEVGQFVLVGNIYAENLGWISLGSGVPIDGIQYHNDSSSDFGVNLDTSGNLRGLAYGANIGWIQFEATGAPKIDLNIGRLSGFAYGANIGWINLGDSSFGVIVDSISAGADTDGDGIPDAWELGYAGNLTTLSHDGDADHDGQTDYQEYLADTNPLNPEDGLHIIGLTLSSDESAVSLVWSTKPTRVYRIQTLDMVSASWMDSGLGIVRPDGATTTRLLPAGAQLQFFRVQAVRALAQ